MKIILTHDVETLGKSGDILVVKDGYARNYLIPRGMAKQATSKTIASIQKKVEQTAIRDAKARENMNALADQLNKMTLKFTMKSGDDERIFGSVTSQMIADAIIAKGYPVDKREVDLPEPIKHVGNHFVDIKLRHGITGRIKVKVTTEI